MKRLAFGLQCAWSGIVRFGKTPRYWPYALLPMLLLLLFYAAAIYLAAVFLLPLLEGWTQGTVENPFLVFLFTAVRWSLRLLFSILMLLLVAITFGSIYEIFGVLFFDRLLLRFEATEFGWKPELANFRHTLLWLREGIRFGLITLLISLLLFIASFLLPGIGTAAALLFAGYRLGISCLFSPAANRGWTPARLHARRRQFRLETVAFGLAGALLLIIPFSVILLLPGLALGGALLFRRLAENAIEPETPPLPRE